MTENCSQAKSPRTSTLRVSDPVFPSLRIWHQRKPVARFRHDSVSLKAELRRIGAFSLLASITTGSPFSIQSVAALAISRFSLFNGLLLTNWLPGFATKVKRLPPLLYPQVSLVVQKFRACYSPPLIFVSDASRSYQIVPLLSIKKGANFPNCHRDPVRLVLLRKAEYGGAAQCLWQGELNV
jgi:hypothetical protein